MILFNLLFIIMEALEKYHGRHMELWRRACVWCYYRTTHFKDDVENYPEVFIAEEFDNEEYEEYYIPLFKEELKRVKK